MCFIALISNENTGHWYTCQHASWWDPPGHPQGSEWSVSPCRRLCQQIFMKFLTIKIGRNIDLLDGIMTVKAHNRIGILTDTNFSVHRSTLGWGWWFTLNGAYYYILWPDFMWYTGMWSPNGDQSGQWRSISMTSQWPIFITSQWDAHCEITMGNDIARDIHCDVTMNMMLLCLHMASQCIITLLWTFSIMYFLFYA